MRLFAVGLIVGSLLAVPFIPVAEADCRISLRNPTDPQWSSDCTEVGSEIQEVMNGSAEMTTTLNTTSEYVVNQTIKKAGLCDGDLSCGSLFEANLTVEINSTNMSDPLMLVANVTYLGTESYVNASRANCEILFPVSDRVKNPCWYQQR